MTKVGIISDVHSNKDALYQVLEDMEKRGVDKIICLGDIVTKYAYPREVVETLKSNCDLIIKGNCDENVVQNTNFKFARGKLGLENIEYLSELPLKEQLEYQKLILNFFHATPNSITKIYNPLLDASHSEMLIGDQPQINFAGHTHIPYINSISPNEMRLTTSGKVTLNPNGIYVMNPGSVGDPLIPNPNPEGSNKWLIGETLSYILFDINEKETTAEIIELPYKELLTKVYQDFVQKQQPDAKNERRYPRSPMDTRKIYESLENMNVDNIPNPEEIDNPKRK